MLPQTNQHNNQGEDKIKVAETFVVSVYTTMQEFKFFSQKSPPNQGNSKLMLTFQIFGFLVVIEIHS